MGLGDSYRERVDRKLDRIEAGEAPVRVPLTAGQHILHLLLTVVTAGLWLPVWIFRAVRGNHHYLPPGVRGSLPQGPQR